MAFKEWKGNIRINRLFIKIACVVVSGVAAVSAFTLGAALQTTRDGYITTLTHSNRQILSEVESNMESTNDTITQVLLTISNSWAFRQYLLSEDGDPSLFTLVYDMEKQLEAVIPGQFYDVAVVSPRGQSYVSNGTSLSLSIPDLLSSEVTKEAAANPNRIIYRYVDKGITNRSAGHGAFLALKALMYPGTHIAFGFAYVVLREEDMQAFMGKVGSSVNQQIILNGSKIVASTGSGAGGTDAALAKIIDAMDKAGQYTRFAQLNGRRVIVITQTMERWNLHIAYELDYASVLHEMSGSAYILLICLLVSVAVLAAVSIFIRQMTKPIEALAHTMATVTQKGLPKHIEPVKGGFEVRQLSSAFSIMIDNLNRDVEQLMELEKEKRSIEIQTLQMQINPHMIYNSLTSIKWLIWQGESEKAVQSLDTFTMLLHSTVSNSREFVTVEEEIENLKNYIFLQKIRYGGQIQTDVYLSPQAKACRMPKLLLQPLLENAFFHAFPDRLQGMISVFAGRHGDELVFEVIDDGVGMTQHEADNLLARPPKKDGHSIGIRNVNTRIRLLFGEAYGVWLYSEPGHGTTAKIVIPAISEDEKPENNDNLKNNS